MGDESMLQALESTADQIDRLTEIIDECLTMAEAGVQMSATTPSEVCRGDGRVARAAGAVAEDVAAFLGADRWQRVGFPGTLRSMRVHFGYFTGHSEFAQFPARRESYFGTGASFDC